MILDLFIYIIQFYINQNTFLPGFIIRKEEANKKSESEKSSTKVVNTKKTKTTVNTGVNTDFELNMIALAASMGVAISLLKKKKYE